MSDKETLDEVIDEYNRLITNIKNRLIKRRDFYMNNDDEFSADVFDEALYIIYDEICRHIISE